MNDDVPVFSAMLRSALAGRVRPESESFVEMFAEDGVMEFPFGLEGFTTVHGRAQLAERLAAQGDTMQFVAMSEPVVHEVADGRTVVLEFVGTVTGVRSGETSEQKLVSIVTTEGGYITHFTDYWNPLTFLGAVRGQAWLESVLQPAS